MLVYPAAGLRVRDPATGRHVPDDGLEVSETDLTWVRLLRDGDVVTELPASREQEVAEPKPDAEVSPPADAEPTPPAEAPAEEHA